MLRPIKIKTPDDKVWFLGDLHHNHSKSFILAPRGFTTVQESNEALIARWNEIVKDDDIAFHLGDFMLESTENDFWNLLRRLKFGRLCLMLGNHNAAQKDAYRKILLEQFPEAFDETGQSADHYEIYPLNEHLDGNPLKVITFLPEYVEVSVGKTRLVLAHYPLESWNHMAHGSIHLHAHCHNNLKHVMPLRIDVGIEHFGRPISLAHVKDLTKGQEPAKVDHHG